MIKTLASLTAAMAICTLLVACEDAHPEDAAHDKGPRPVPAPMEAPGPGNVSDQPIQGGAAPGGTAPGGGGARTGG